MVNRSFVIYHVLEIISFVVSAFLSVYSLKVAFILLTHTYEDWLDDYDIDHVKPSPYYLSKNGQADVTNKALLRVLSRMIYKKLKSWVGFLYLWAYCTLKRTATQGKSFFLFYRSAEVV